MFRVWGGLSKSVGVRGIALRRLLLVLRGLLFKSAVMSSSLANASASGPSASYYIFFCEFSQFKKVWLYPNLEWYSFYDNGSNY